MRNPIEEFRDAICAAGLQAPRVILADGVIHRFASAPGRPDRTGWFVLHLDGTPAGVFGCWRTGLTQSWRPSKSPAFSPKEQASNDAKVHAARRQRDMEQQRNRKSAAARARYLWEVAAPAEWSHPYLRSKSIEPHGLQQRDGNLMVPLTIAGELVNLQLIQPDGRKRFLKGGLVAEAYHVIGELSEPGSLYICEGFATGATLREEIGMPVVCAMSAGNLVAVATMMRARFPVRDIVIAADNDRFTRGNPGISAAMRAQAAAKARMIWPRFPDMTDGTDFNDLRRTMRKMGRT